MGASYGRVLFWLLLDGLFPGNHFCMARLALLAIFAFVYVVCRMTVNAFLTETFIFINANLVTIHAFGPDVFAD